MGPAVLVTTSLQIGLPGFPRINPLIVEAWANGLDPETK